MKNDFENPFGQKDVKGNTRMMSNLLDMAVFPGIQGGPLEHIIASKAISFGEILTDEFTAYAKQIMHECPGNVGGIPEKRLRHCIRRYRQPPYADRSPK